MSTNGITLVAATSIEARAVRKHCAGARIVQSGVAFADISPDDVGDAAISCGLAGGLRNDLPTGTILIPREVRTPSGDVIVCDETISEQLRIGALQLGYPCVTDPLLTSATIVNGTERARWAVRGYAGVDMETGLLRARRVAAVRVILDTPQHELSSDWVAPLRAMLRPSNWTQAVWLARNAPRCAELSARIAAYAVR